MIPHWQTLIHMGWPQLKKNPSKLISTAAGVVNNTIFPHRSKMMDMLHLWWLRCGASKDQLCYQWDAGSKNWADYHAKHHPSTYHEAHQSTHAGI